MPQKIVANFFLIYIYIYIYYYISQNSRNKIISQTPKTTLNACYISHQLLQFQQIMIRAKLETLSSLKNLISNSLKENLEYNIVLDL